MSIEDLGDKIDQLPALFVGYKLDPGGIEYILNETVPTLEELQFQRGLELAKKAREAQKRALGKQYSWDQRKSGDPLARDGAKELDDRIDQTLSSLLQGLQTFATFPEGNDKRRIAEELISEYFPRGVFPITSKTYINQRAHVGKLVGQLRDHHRSELEKLALAELVDELADLNEQFGERLNPQNDDVSYDEVRAARSEAEEAFYEFFAAVVGEYGDDLETLNEVIRPYLEVNTRIRRHLKRGGTKPQVDPESGEPIEPTDGESSGESRNDGGSSDDGEQPDEPRDPQDESQDEQGG